MVNDGQPDTYTQLMGRILDLQSWQTFHRGNFYACGTLIHIKLVMNTLNYYEVFFFNEKINIILMLLTVFI